MRDRLWTLRRINTFLRYKSDDGGNGLTAEERMDLNALRMKLRFKIRKLVTAKEK